MINKGKIAVLPRLKSRNPSSTLFCPSSTLTEKEIPSFTMICPSSTPASPQTTLFLFPFQASMWFCAAAPVSTESARTKPGHFLEPALCPFCLQTLHVIFFVAISRLLNCLVGLAGRPARLGAAVGACNARFATSSRSAVPGAVFLPSFALSYCCRQRTVVSKSLRW